MSTFNQPAPPTPAAHHETGKKRGSRISLDYFKRSTYLERWKNWLSILLLLGAVAYVGYALAGDHKPVSRGPVASVHAAWDNNCQACHENFSGVHWKRLVGGSASHTASDAKCETCHSGAVHHASMKESSAVSCGGCHRDHRGRDASLTRLPDSDCTSCHTNLKDHMKEGLSTGYANAITSFAGDHPSFKLPKEAGHLKFNHALHMKPGQSDGIPAVTLATIQKNAPEAFARYRDAAWQEKKDGGDAVVLDCASCHVADPGDLGGKSHKAPQPSGAYMLPVSYDASCKACHPLSFDPTVKTTLPDGTKTLMQVPHHLQPPQVEDFLWGVYADEYVKRDPDKNEALVQAIRNAPRGTRPLPGHEPPGIDKAKDWINAEIKRTQAVLAANKRGESGGYVLASCAECHVSEGTGEARRIKGTDVPVIWQPHARFNHSSHRSMDCRSCHENAYAFNADGQPHKGAVETLQPDKLLPEINNCRQCHAPPSGSGAGALGGVRHDCTECHSYHNGDHFGQGLGARALDPKKLLTAEELLHSGKK